MSKSSMNVAVVTNPKTVGDRQVAYQSLHHIQPDSALTEVVAVARGRCKQSVRKIPDEH